MGSVDEEGSYPPNIETLGLFSAAFPSRLITGSNKWIDGTDSMLYETSWKIFTKKLTVEIIVCKATDTIRNVLNSILCPTPPPPSTTVQSIMTTAQPCPCTTSKSPVKPCFCRTDKPCPCNTDQMLHDQPQITYCTAPYGGHHVIQDHDGLDEHLCPAYNVSLIIYIDGSGKK